MSKYNQTEQQLVGFLERAMSIIAELVHDNDDCFYDHHGNCQAHGESPNPCPHARAKILTAELHMEGI